MNAPSSPVLPPRVRWGHSAYSASHRRLAFRIARAGRIGRDITAMATLLIVIVELIFRLGLPLIFKTMQIAALLIAITVPVHLLCWAVVRIGDAVYGKPVS